MNCRVEIFLNGQLKEKLFVNVDPRNHETIGRFVEHLKGFPILADAAKDFSYYRETSVSVDGYDAHFDEPTLLLLGRIVKINFYSKP
jgi:hypothetical protein